MSKVASTRITEAERLAIAEVRGDRSVSEWLHGLIEQELARRPPRLPEVPDAVPEVDAARFCAHPEGKRVGDFCVGCSRTVGTPVTAP